MDCDRLATGNTGDAQNSAASGGHLSLAFLGPRLRAFPRLGVAMPFPEGRNPRSTGTCTRVELWNIYLVQLYDTYTYGQVGFLPTSARYMYIVLVFTGPDESSHTTDGTVRACAQPSGEPQHKLHSAGDHAASHPI